MSNVLKFEPVTVGASYRIDADGVLDEAKGIGFVRMMVLGELEDGSVYSSGNCNPGELLVLMEFAKRALLFGDE